MNIVTDIMIWQKLRADLGKKSIGFVPTMGNLHEGHGSLFAKAREQNEIVVASIFVNPTQFNQESDFQKYPRTMEDDCELLKNYQVDYLLMFDAKALYPDDYQVQVQETVLSEELEGQYRPGHFTGMLTIVLKLLNLVQPKLAYFGEKDYQQLMLVQKMVKALFLPIEIVPCATIRSDDGLALSSRNSRLNLLQRERAVEFAQTLQSDATLGQIQAKLKSSGFKVDYVADKWNRRLAAVWVDDVRLIDNISRS